MVERDDVRSVYNYFFKINKTDICQTYTPKIGWIRLISSGIYKLAGISHVSFTIFMNRLIIIGNGFDLAHNLETKYSDFLEHYWSTIVDGHDDGIVSFSCKYLWSPCNNMADFQLSVIRANHYNSNTVQFKIHNGFFETLNNNIQQDSTWVDIERFYYRQLKIYWSSDKKRINNLNKEFSTVKKIFEEYILHAINSCDEKDNLQFPEMSAVFENFLKHNENGSKYFDETFTKKLPEQIANSLYGELVNNGGQSRLHVLVFNYTDTIKCYEEQLHSYTSYAINHIHGEAGSEDNEVVFGYGDEKDSLFSEIKDSNINSYVEFLKSTAYLKTRNHFDLMNFIEGGGFVVDVLGHSCGLSDRTLLKTIFENNNCKQIFLHFHKWKTEGKYFDNFNDLSINISRHFDDQITMRKKVANKLFCSPLPQKPSKKE